MPADPRLIRASDQDRDRVATMLREHHAVGRIDPTEFQERLDKVYTAKTMGELDDLTADLPAVDPYPLPTASMPRHPPPASWPGSGPLANLGRGTGRLSPAWQAAWGSWLTCSLLSTVIWLLTGAGYPWPLWVALPWGAILAGRWVTGTGPQGHGRGRRRELGRRNDEISGPSDRGSGRE
jgi:hypothetical protein